MAADTADVSISKLTIADGLADLNTTPNSSTGGAILVNEGSSLVLKDAVLKDNKAVGDKDTVIAPTPIYRHWWRRWWWDCKFRHVGQIQAVRPDAPLLNSGMK
jgi:hypothetical protein